MKRIVCAAVALVALSFSCGEKGQKPEAQGEKQKPATKAQVQKKGAATKTESKKPSEAKTTYEAKGGKLVVTEKGGAEKYVIAPKGGASVPEGFPKDIPLYKGAAIVASYKMSEGFMVMVQTTDAHTKAVENCKTALKDQGWSLDSSFDTPQMLLLMYKKGKRELNLGVSKAEGPTRIQYQVSAE